MNPSRHATVELETSNQTTDDTGSQTQAGSRSQTSPSTNQTEEIPRNMANIPPPAGVDPALWNGIMAVATAFAAVPHAAAPAPPANGGNGGNPPPAIKSAEDVGYFDPGYEDPSGTDQPIVTAGRHSFYRNVYTFTDHLRSLEKTASGDRVRDLISTCLKGEALRWFETELTEIEKDYFREATVEKWCTNLVKRFKERTPTALKKLQTESYTYADARRGRTPRSYMQNILRHARAANYPSVYHQCTTAWNNMELDFRSQIPEPPENITLSAFLSMLDAKESVWMALAARQRSGNNSNSSGSGFGNNNAGKSNRQTSKQNRRQDGQQQSFAAGPQFPPYWPPPGYNSYPYQNPAYRPQRPQYQSSGAQSQNPPAAPALPPAKQPLRITSGSASDSKNQTKPSANAGKYNNTRGGKAKAYAAEESDEEQEEAGEGFHEEAQEEYYAANDDLDYYDPAYQGSYDEDEAPVNFTLAKRSQPRCRVCRKPFTSNNSLHRHIRAEHQASEAAAFPVTRSITTAATKGTSNAPDQTSKTLPTPDPLIDAAALPASQKPSADAAVLPASRKPSADAATKPPALSAPTLIWSTADSSKDVGTGYGFRG